MDTYFTFPDGALRYDCARCRQQCCRGKGIGLGADELVALVARRPALASQIRLRPGGTFAAVNLADGCWFLDDGGMCTVETLEGRALKPSTCRLFPFNRVFRVGDVRVVDFNSVLCPLEAADGAGVRHDDLAREIDELAGSPLVDTPAWSPPGLDGAWLSVEQRASEAAREHASDAGALARASGEPDEAALVKSWAALHGIAPAELARLEAAVAPRVALLAPSLRWNRIFHKQAPPYPETVRRLGRRVRALHFLGALGARIAGAPPSLRGLTELWQSHAETLDVMERWTDPVKLAAPHFGADVPSMLLPALGALLAGAFRGGKTLGELVSGAAALLGPSDRPLAIALAANQLATLFPT